MNLEKILKTMQEIWDEEILDYPQLFELAKTYDKDLLDALFENKDSKEKFFIQVGDSHVFKYNEFRFYLEENQVNNSFTQYANKIGLSSQGEHLNDSTDYVLDWPYKDCVLEGGMSSEEDMDTFIEKKVETTPGKIDKKTGTVISTEKTEVTFSQAKRKREEIFYNNIIADKEIDRLLDKKALKNFTRYTAKGEEEVKEIKRDEDGTIKENLLIKGNNLLTLHSLKEQFAGKVKLIYIDPPYNTGGDGFDYNDRFNHSTWLTFMKNRLEISSELLRKDGVIFISCDDNEQAYLKVLMDQVFGRDNFISNFVVTSAPAGTQSSTNVAQQHAYCLAYRKSKSFESFRHKLSKEEINKKYKDGTDEYGPYLLERLWKRGIGGRKEDVPSLHFPVYFNPNNDEILLEEEVENKNNLIKIIPYQTEGVLGRWTWSKTKMINEREKLLVKETSGEYKLYRKKYVDEEIGRLPYSIINSDIGRTELGSLELKNLMGGKVFDYPKYSALIKYFLKTGSDKDDIVLDFFSGSATTAHAVIDLNQEDSGNRKFILIEQMNYIEDVGKPRIKKVLEELNVDDNFIYFELAEYNEEAKNKIDACKSYKELKKLFTELTDYYFLNYNVSVKQFNDQLLDDEDFQELPLEEQKILFKALLDNNQLYIPHKEQEDGKYNLSKEDQELTNEFYG
jgi:adenine-specific DNA-methyltransferase